MNEKKRGGWTNPASAANGRRGGRPRKAEADKRVQRSVNLSPEAWAILASHVQPGESENSALDRLLKERGKLVPDTP